MRRLRSAPRLAAALLLVTTARAADDEAGFAPLFDGKTLAGWSKVGGGATYRVDDGCIVGEVGPGPNTFLKTDKAFGDFVLKLDVKLDVPGNSGIQIRSHTRTEKSGERVFGYQCEIDPSPRAWTGGLYDEGRRGWLQSLEGRPAEQKAFRLDGWNSFVIEARGPHLRTTVNGIACADLLDAVDLDGFIALQVHSGKAGAIRWKNIRIKDEGTSRYTPLSDGKTLAGWTGGVGWSVDDGSILGRPGKRNPGQSSLLLSDWRGGDFAVRLKFRADRGDGGVVVRAQRANGGPPAGTLIALEDGTSAGSILPVGGGEIESAKVDDVVKWLKLHDWNELTVIALGDRTVVQLNGHQTSALTESTRRGPGQIALQADRDGDGDGEVRFKDIEILPIGPAPATPANRP